MGLSRTFIFIFSVVTFSGATSTENFSTQHELEIHRLTNALHPFQDEIRSTWTRRTTTTQEDSGGMLTCHLCQGVMPLIKEWTETYTHEELQQFVISGCKLLSLAPRPEICDPIIKAYTNQFLYIIENTATENVEYPHAQICAILTPNCDHPVLNDWTIDIEGEKPPPVDREILAASGSPTTKIIQFTDLHVDLDYLPGTNTICGEGMPICCREYEGIPEDESLQAGLYGDFHCALPIDTLKELYTHAKNNYPEARYVFLTGDYIHSGVWLYNKTENSRHVVRVTELLAEIFPDKDNVTILPLVGNHEPHVVNMYPPKDLWGNEEFDISWLYRDVLTPFRVRDPDFLSEGERDRFLSGGYYSISPEPGLRIIVLNTNICSSENFWLAFNPYTDAREQLQWLADVLKEAEDEGDSVLIVGHVEVGNCWPTWSGKFNEIVNRFQGIIRGSFFGHSHKPQYRVSMDNGTMNPVFASYIAGSGLPDLMNPAYSVFHVDGERGRESKWDVLRHELIVMNLAESNSQRKPVIGKLTDSFETFGMDNLGPQSVLKLAEDLICNQELVDRYLTFHSKGDDSLAHRTCMVQNATCMSDIVCNIVSSNGADQKPCRQLRSQVEDTKCPRSSAGALTVSYGAFLIFLCILFFSA